VSDVLRVPVVLRGEDWVWLRDWVSEGVRVKLDVADTLAVVVPDGLRVCVTL